MDCQHVDHGGAGRWLRSVDGDIITACGDYTTPALFLRGWLARGGTLRGSDLVHLVRQWPWEVRSLAGLGWCGADLGECHAAGLDFSGGDFTLALLRSGNFRGADFSGTLLAGTIMDAANFHGASLRGARIIPHESSAGGGRHRLRPQADEFIHWDRALARCADFESADLGKVLMVQADLTAASLAGAVLAGTIIERCTLDGAIMTEARLTGATIMRTSMITATLCEVDTARGAVFRTCEYVEMPVPRTITESSWRFPGLLVRYLGEEISRWRRLPGEIRVDYRRMLVSRAVVLGSVPVLALLAWRYVETNALLGLITAVGAATTFALRRYFTIGLQSLVGFLLGRANDAEGLWRSGLRGRRFVRAALRGGVAQDHLRRPAAQRGEDHA